MAGAYENPIYIDPAGSIRAVAKTIGGLGDDATNYAKASAKKQKKDKEQEKKDKKHKSDKTEKELEMRDRYRHLDKSIDAKLNSVNSSSNTQTEKPKFGDDAFQSTRSKFTLNGDGDKSGNASMNRLEYNTNSWLNPDKPFMESIFERSKNEFKIE